MDKETQRNIHVVLLVVLLVIQRSQCRSGGAPPTSCQTLLPSHGQNTPRTTTSPYAVLVSQNLYKPGETIQVMLRGLCQTILKGFLVQARRIDPRDPRSKQDPIGKFTLVPGARYECGNNESTLTHSSPYNGTSIRFNWTAPDTPQGHLQIFATIVLKFDTFWSKLTSVVIQDSTAQPLSSSPNDLRTPFIQPCESDRPTSPAPVTTTLATTSLFVVADANSTHNQTEQTTALSLTTVAESSTMQQWTTMTSFVTATQIKLTNKTAALQPPDWSKSTASEGTLEEAKCGQDRGCFIGCNSKSCDFIVMWSNLGDYFWFYIKARRLPGANGQYIALAFSSDQTMGSDSVVDCIQDGDQLSVHVSYNTRYGNTVMTHLNKVMLNQASVKNPGDDLLYCQFARKKIVEENKAHDLSTDVYLMLAQGSLLAGVKQEHSRVPVVSGRRLDLRTYDVSRQLQTPSILIKAHACLMLFAWLFCASIGTVMARFYKPLWPKTKICGRKVWYTVHRLCMLIAGILTIIAFVLIFYEVQGLSEISILRLKKLHPVVGIATTCLVILQVLMGLFRPSSTSVNRPVFNYGHWLLGIVTHVATVFNIVIGCGLQKAAVHFTIVYLVYAFAIYQIVVIVVLEIIFCNIRVNVKKQQSYSIYEMRNTIYSSTKDLLEDVNSEPPRSSLLKFILGTHILLIASITTTVIAMIVLMPSNAV
ncbi:ferric-chelate reductase 1 [Biomphalaria glabrata]|uniref:Ferric-chelate reductase 1 homolog n=1 Tax=Biomphalaria glabrata TaxID=6526 RepID=A0A9W3AFF1_BIOGL|nr:putative ferric-chelate reductase 1 homolog [Biomphalaria glabrata]KAI8754550.1 putative ferric-chelate reductase 1; partial [Biomphalaria glabrata]